MYVYRLCEDSVDNLMHITVTMNDKSLDYGGLLIIGQCKGKEDIIWIIFKSFSARLNFILVTPFLCQMYCLFV